MSQNKAPQCKPVRTLIEDANNNNLLTFELLLIHNKISENIRTLILLMVGSRVNFYPFDAFMYLKIFMKL